MSRVTPDARILTVTSQVAVFPLAVVTVIVAVPALIAVTVPFVTVAMLVFEEVQVSVLSVVLSGVIVAVKVSLLPFKSESEVLFNVTPVATTVVSSGESSPPLLSPLSVLPPSSVLLSSFPFPLFVVL